MRIEDARPAIISKREYQRVKKLLGSRAPKQTNPRRESSPYLLSGILRCESCGRAMSASEVKSGKYTYYVCQSLMMRVSGTCKPPRLNDKKIENTIAAFAEEMSGFLTTSELTETKAFVHSFVKEIRVKPGRAAIIYSMPTTDDSPLGGPDPAEIALNGGVRKSLRHGGDGGTRTPNPRLAKAMLYQLSHVPCRDSTRGTFSPADESATLTAYNMPLRPLGSIRPWGFAGS